jgi:hypothetical protein
MLCGLPASIASSISRSSGVPLSPTNPKRSVDTGRRNETLAPRDIWHVVRPRRHPTMDVALTFMIPLQGSGGGGASGGGQKNVLATVATIAVLLAAAAVSGGALDLPALSFLSAGAVNSLAGATVGLGGRLATDCWEVRNVSDYRN